ncbi:hypothetical protein [uncultured Arthrobacter sp.]|uniref:hypothetical protein n=1 Tax=uncultured Arthrobacter sp. TaxID=114050 RepID=UPI00262DEB5B|nr:hypothetical protein [uncultured Arthrobacter sp.]
MRTPLPLPDPFESAPFTVADSDSAGISRKRIYNGRFTSSSQGIRVCAERQPSTTELLRAYTSITEQSFASHQTAGFIWGFFHYSCEGDQEVFHISRPAGGPTPRRTNVRGHSTLLPAEEVTEYDGVRLTTRARTWLDLAERLSVDELVVIADQLIRYPRKEFEGRSEPYCTKNDLQRVIDRHPRKRGVRKAREALDLARVGADSPPETRLRLALVYAGLPEPAVNIPIVDENGIEWHQPDLSYPEFRISIQYDGGGHSEQDQVDRDISRAEQTIAIDWSEVRVSNRHMSNEAKAAVAKVRSELVAKGWRPNRR